MHGVENNVEARMRRTHALVERSHVPGEIVVEGGGCTGKLAGRPCKDYFKAGEQVNLNNLYLLTTLPVGRRFQWPRRDEAQRV